MLTVHCKKSIKDPVVKHTGVHKIIIVDKINVDCTL